MAELVVLGFMACAPKVVRQRPGRIHGWEAHAMLSVMRILLYVRIQQE